jgi:hypothetical protein
LGSSGVDAVADAGSSGVDAATGAVVDAGIGAERVPGRRRRLERAKKGVKGNMKPYYAYGQLTSRRGMCVGIS